MILVTGPTGSGKSTTLYATLNIVSRPEVNVITVEDPVEYRLPGINQVQTNNKAGLTFSSALRSILRSDPDIVLLGEIRDGETAHIAVEAALTGHLVLSTLHTNDAPGAISRLIEMGIEPFLVGSAVDCVVAQRLARRLCPKCKEAYQPTAQALIENRFPWQDGMIIIGVLAGIAIPIFIKQRAKAHDAATKADVSNLGKEVATYFVDGSGPLVLTWAGGGQIDLTDGGYTTYARLTVGSRPPAAPADQSNLNDPTGWCVALTDPKGSEKTFKYTAMLAGALTAVLFGRHIVDAYVAVTLG